MLPCVRITVVHEKSSGPPARTHLSSAVLAAIAAGWLQFDVRASKHRATIFPGTLKGSVTDTHTQRRCRTDRPIPLERPAVRMHRRSDRRRLRCGYREHEPGRQEQGGKGNRVSSHHRSVATSQVNAKPQLVNLQ